MRSIAVVLAIGVAGPASAQTPAPAAKAESTTQFLVFLRSQPIGREEVARAAVAGWLRGPRHEPARPADRHHLAYRGSDYDLEWRPKSLHIDGVVRGQDVALKTTFAGGKAINSIAIQGKAQPKEDPVALDTVVLPNAFLGSYAALARRLQGKAAGAELRGYIAPQAEIPITVTAVAPERIETPKGVINVTRYALIFNNPPPAGNLIVNLWADQNGDLIRMSIPAQSIELAREDIASAAARTAAFSTSRRRAGDNPGARIQSRRHASPGRRPARRRRR